MSQSTGEGRGVDLKLQEKVNEEDGGEEESEEKRQTGKWMQRQRVLQTRNEGKTTET